MLEYDDEAIDDMEISAAERSGEYIQLSMPSAQ